MASAPRCLVSTSPLRSADDVIIDDFETALTQRAFVSFHIDECRDWFPVPECARFFCNPSRSDA